MITSRGACGPIILLLALFLAGCQPSADAPPDADSSAGGEAVDARSAEDEAPVPTGPHGGRLLREGELAVEIALFERGVPPELRLYAWQAGEPVPPAKIEAMITLERLGEPPESLRLLPAMDYLRSADPVTEPHSFDVTVAAQIAGQRARWQYATHEGRVQIEPRIAAQAGITTALAGPGVVRETLTLYGHIEPDPARVRRLGARFPGVVQSVAVQVGERVRAGERLAMIEADQSLRSYALNAPMDGIVIERLADPGEVTAGPLLTLADFGTLWAQLAIFPGQVEAIAVGQPVRLHDARLSTTGRIDYLAPFGAAGPARHARVVLDNTSGAWSPGMAVRGEVVTAVHEAPLVVEARALQRWRDFDVVFARIGEQYEVRVLTLGPTDGEHVQVLAGLRPGTEYVTGNSYLLKAELEKSGASHDH